VVQDVDEAVGVDAAINLDREDFGGELVDDVEHLEGAAIGGGVELEVHRPDHVRLNRRHHTNSDTNTGEPLVLTTLRDPQAFLAPQPADVLVVDLSAGSTRKALGSPDDTTATVCPCSASAQAGRARADSSLLSLVWRRWPSRTGTGSR